MKKLFTLFAVVACTGTALAQKPTVENNVMTLNNNYVIYMCNPGDNKIVENPVGCTKSQVSYAITDELGFLFTSNDGDNTNQVVLTEAYKDAETGAEFPAGYYYTTKVGTSRSYFAGEGLSGIKNVKKMIFYFAQPAKDGVQFSSYYVNETGFNNGSYSMTNRYTRDLNDKIKFSLPLPAGTSNGYWNIALSEGEPAPGDWTCMAAKQPLKLVLDFTKPAEVVDGNMDVQTETAENNEIVIPYGNYLLDYDTENKKEINGDALAWTPDIILQQGYKKPSYLLGIAFICGDDNAATYYANTSESTEEAEAVWHDTQVPAATTALSLAEQATGQYFYFKYSDEYKEYLGLKGAHAPAADREVIMLYQTLTQKDKTSDGNVVQKPGIDDLFSWMTYTNPTSSLDDGTGEVQTANRGGLIDPETDEAMEQAWWGNSPVVADTYGKTMSFNVKETGNFKVYATGSTGSGECYITINAVATDKTTVSGKSDKNIVGKGKASDAFGIDLDPTKEYTVTVSSPSDINLYAIALSKNKTSGISSIMNDEQNTGNGAMYNLAGQRISAPVSGQIYIMNGKKYIKK